MKNSFTFPALFVVMLVAGAALAGWLFFWNSQAPVSSASHSHADPHEHTHTHGDGLEHGHEHEGLDGEETHSHPHHHSHQHTSGSEPAAAEGLTEVGHLHGESDKTKIFWAKAVVTDKEVEFEFFEQSDEEQKPIDYRPGIPEFSAQLFNGSKLEGDFKIELKDERFVGSLPQDFFHLPTHSLRVRELFLGGEEFEAVVPLSKE